MFVYSPGIQASEMKRVNEITKARNIMSAMSYFDLFSNIEQYKKWRAKPFLKRWMDVYLCESPSEINYTAAKLELTKRPLSHLSKKELVDFKEILEEKCDHKLFSKKDFHIDYLVSRVREIEEHGNDRIPVPFPMLEFA